MGGERASTTRMRERGQICCSCRRLLDSRPWDRHGERYCDKCQPNRRIYMSFFQRHGWVCGFLEADLKTSICRRRVFGSPDKIREMIARTPTPMDIAAKEALEHAIEMGRGGVFLEVTTEQYARLKG